VSFSPVVPIGGLAGWQFLTRTLASQRAAHDQSPLQIRETEAFRARIGDVRTAEDLVSDRTLLKVALGAFGLADDIDNRFFIRKVLEEGTRSDTSLANRLSDPRYAALADAFAFDSPIGPRTALSSFSEEIITAYEERSFETAVGDKNANLRLALGLERELEQLVARTKGGDAQWFSVIGNPPLRKVFETAFGLSPRIGSLDIDQQLGIFKEKAQTAFGTSAVADFVDPERLSELRSGFLLRAQLTEPSSAGVAPGAAGTALAILSGGSSSERVLSALYGV